MQPLPHFEKTPPFRFTQQEAGIDPEATAREGYEVPKLATFIHILPHGHSDESVFEAVPWIANKTREASEGRYDPRWIADFKAGYDAFIAGNAIPETGTPLIFWERILKTRRQQLMRQFPTLEDLAACPDSSLGLIGLDGRVLRDMARNEIRVKQDMEPVVKELADANERNRQLSERLETVTRRLEILEAASAGNKRSRAEAA